MESLLYSTPACTHPVTSSEPTDTTSELQLLNNLIGSRYRTGGHHNITYPVRGNVTIRRHLNNTNDYDWNRNFVAKEWDDATTNDSRRRRPLANKMRQDRRTSQQDGQASQPSNKQRPTNNTQEQPKPESVKAQPINCCLHFTSSLDGLVTLFRTTDPHTTFHTHRPCTLSPVANATTTRFYL